jgi:hypothetical protein
VFCAEPCGACITSPVDTGSMQLLTSRSMQPWPKDCHLNPPKDSNCCARLHFQTWPAPQAEPLEPLPLKHPPHSTPANRRQVHGPQDAGHPQPMRSGPLLQHLKGRVRAPHPPRRRLRRLPTQPELRAGPLLQAAPAQAGPHPRPRKVRQTDSRRLFGRLLSRRL